MKKTKSQKKREKIIKQKQRLKALEASENQFVIEAVNGIEIAYENRAFEDIVTEKSIQHISNLSKIAIRQFHKEGPGSFLIISEVSAKPSSLISVRNKWEPNLAMVIAVARPIPLAAPVIKHFLPLKSFIFYQLVHH